MFFPPLTQMFPFLLNLFIFDIMTLLELFVCVAFFTIVLVSLTFYLLPKKISEMNWLQLLVLMLSYAIVFLVIYGIVLIHVRQVRSHDFTNEYLLAITLGTSFLHIVLRFIYVPLTHSLVLFYALISSQIVISVYSLIFGIDTFLLFIIVFNIFAIGLSGVLKHRNYPMLFANYNMKWPMADGVNPQIPLSLAIYFSTLVDFSGLGIDIFFWQTVTLICMIWAHQCLLNYKGPVWCHFIPAVSFAVMLLQPYAVMFQTYFLTGATAITFRSENPYINGIKNILVDFIFYVVLPALIVSSIPITIDCVTYLFVNISSCASDMFNILLKSASDAIFNGIVNLGTHSTIDYQTNQSLKAAIWNKGTLLDLQKTISQTMICNTSGCIDASRYAKTVVDINQSLLNANINDVSLHAESAKQAIEAKANLSDACQSCSSQSAFYSTFFRKS